MDISIITSAYRAEAFLPQYRQHILNVARELHEAGLALEIVIVANDATTDERQSIEALVQATDDTASVVPIYVPRERLYASWNRGMRVARGVAFGMWNVDDIHFAEAYIEGYQHIRAGYTLVDFPHDYVTTTTRYDGRERQARYTNKVMYKQDNPGRKNGFSPFTLFARSIYDQIGPFDERFFVAGDLDWSIRSVPYARFYRSAVHAGEFHIHGNNLSNTYNLKELAEVNIIFLRRGQWSELIPIEPDIMRERWQTWGPDAKQLPREIEDWLWGAGAKQRARLHYILWKYQFLRRLRAALLHRGLLRHDALTAPKLSSSHG